MKMHPVVLTIIAAVTLLVASAPPCAASPAPSGSWIVGEVDGDDFDVLLELREGIGTLRGRRSNDGFRNMRLIVESTQGGLHTMRLEAEQPGRPPGRAWLLMQTADEGLLWTSKHDSLLLVRRRIAMPSSLLGEWKVARPGEPVQRVTVTSGSITWSAEGKDEVFGAWPVAPSGSTVDVVLAAGDGEGRIHHFQPLPDGSVLTWRAESSEYRVLYRGDQAPAWLAPARP